MQDPREARRRVRGSGSRVVVEVCGGGCGEEVAVVAGFGGGLGREDGHVVVRIGDGEGGGRRRGCGREGKVKGEEEGGEWEVDDVRKGDGEEVQLR